MIMQYNNITLREWRLRHLIALRQLGEEDSLSGQRLSKDHRWRNA